MKLVFVTDNGFSSDGENFYYSGANVQHYSTMTNIFEDITFIAKNNDYDNSENLISPKYDTFLVENLLSTSNFISNYRNLNKVLTREIPKADIVIAFGINGYFASKIAKKYNKAIISYIGGCIYDTLNNMDSKFKKIMAPIMKRLIQNMTMNSDYVHYVDDYLVERYPTNGKILICPSVRLKIDDTKIKDRIKKIKSPSNDVYLGIIGYAHNKIKGIDTIIRSMEHLPHNVKLQVVGRGDHSWLDRIIIDLNLENRIEFLGTINDRQQLFNWLDNVDIYLQPSLTEGMPRATLEAMSRGCPVISTSVGGLKSIIESDYRIDTGDVKDLSNKINQLYDNEEELIRISKVNFEKAKSFDFDILNKKRDDFYLNIYEEVKSIKNTE